MSIRTVAIALLGASAVFAAPSRNLAVRQLSPGAADVNDQIQGWQDDIANVNGFLDTAADDTESGPQLGQTAANLLQNIPGAAADEPNRLMALAGLISTSDTASEGAVTTLMNIFGGVLTNLTTIEDNTGDLGSIGDAVALINCLRCNFVLPNIDQVYAGAVAVSS